MDWSEIVEKYGIKTYKELIARQYSYLDKIDFQPYIDKYDDLDELWVAIEDDYNNSGITQNDFLDGLIFHWMKRNLLCRYLKEKYGIRYHEETIIKYYKDSD